MDIGKLTPEQMEKAKACKTGKELMDFAKAEGFELSEEELAKVSGGEEWNECGEYEECNFFHDW